VRFKQKLLNLVVLYSAQTRKREGQNKLNEIKHMLTSSGQEPHSTQNLANCCGQRQ